MGFVKKKKKKKVNNFEGETSISYAKRVQGSSNEVSEAISLWAGKGLE